MWQVRISRRVVLATFLACVHAVTARADNDVNQAVRMPVRYPNAMVVIVARDGAGAVRFSDPFEFGNDSGNGVVGVFYEWRYLERKPGSVQQTGKGRVFAKLVNGAVDHGSVIVRCGPLEIDWTYRDKDSGTVRYNPASVDVHPVSADYFKDRESPAIAAIDLRCFLEEAAAANSAEQPAPKETVTAGPIPYACVLVVKQESGIATFRFGQPFEREHSGNQKHYGVGYEFTFAADEGETREAGQAEVYERYTNGSYDSGELALKAGPIQLEWSRGGNEQGWVYYDPTKVRVWYVDPADAQRLLDALHDSHDRR